MLPNAFIYFILYILFEFYFWICTSNFEMEIRVQVHSWCNQIPHKPELPKLKRLLLNAWMKFIQNQ